MVSVFRLAAYLTSTLGLVLAAPFNASLTAFPTAIPTPAPTKACQDVTDHRIPPSLDCFYRPDPSDPWQTKKPGTVLKFRSAWMKLPDDLIQGSTAGVFPTYNILYRTTDSNGFPTYAVTTVLASPPGNISTPHSLVSYQHFTDTARVDDSPSYKIYDDFYMKLFVQSFLHRGWWVNLPDYEGPSAAFGAGHMGGQATLDSIRATLSMIYGLGMPKPGRYDPATPKIVMYGYSGGALPTAWASQLHSSYAPELVISGAGLGGVTPNAIDTMTKLDAGLLRPLIKGIPAMHPELQHLVIEAFNVNTWDEAMNMLDAKDIDWLRQNIVPVMTTNSAVTDILARDTSLGDHGVPFGVPDFPIVIHRADKDELSLTSDSQKLRDDYCQRGGMAYLHVNPLGGHWNEGEIASGLSLSNAHLGVNVAPVHLILRDMLKGGYSPQKCPDTVKATWDQGLYFNNSNWASA